MDNEIICLRQKKIVSLERTCLVIFYYYKNRAEMNPMSLYDNNK
jgi:hypothetical protein